MKLDYKRDIPLVITFIIGVIAVMDYYTTFTSVKDVFTIIKNFGIVIQAFALGLGAVNLFRVHGRRISKQGADWYLSAWLLLALVLFVAVGLGTGQFEAGTQYQWIYNSLFLPIGATMYSSLAFYMAFGAYKVLRTRNLDAFLLFITAIFVILGNTPIFPATVPTFFYIREWIMTAIVGGSYRGIRIGVGIGAVIIGIKTLIGMETGYLGRR
jgi:Kef-type K+ transport system membrane component KefB